MKLKFRIILMFTAIMLFYAALGVRLFSIQIGSHQEYRAMAKKSSTVEIDRISPIRGEILDRQGELLAINKHTYSIGFNFKYNDMSEKMADDISTCLGISDIKGDEDRGFEWLARHVLPEKAKKVFEYRKDGVVTVKENSRYYPQAPLGAQVIGCVGMDNQGLAGIEYNFDEQLKNSPDSRKFLRDARGKIIYLSGTEEKKSGSIEKLYLTIDTKLQYITERELKKGFKKYNPKWALAIIQDPRSGEILAMGQYPTFDSNSGVPGNVSIMKNMSISNIFEPGSTFKIVTAAAALEEKILDSNDKINCEGGEYEVGGFPIRDFSPHKMLTFENCMVHSSNIAMAKIGDKIGSKMMFKYARDFGFGNFTGIRLPGETRGILRKPDRWSGTSLSRISFGQEIGVTALQLVGAFSAIANGGILYEPRIVDRIQVNGKFRNFKALPIRRVVTRKTAAELSRILKKVVERGSGVQAQVSGYQVAGKTGTAQKYDPNTQTYKEDRYVALFGGFVPADDPKLTIVVVFDEPDTEFYWGGYVAAPVFSAIAQASLNYLNLPPNGEAQ